MVQGRGVKNENKILGASYTTVGRGGLGLV